MVKFDPFGELPIDAPADFTDFWTNKDSEKSRRARKRRSDILNEVGKIPQVPPEILALRLEYSKDYVRAHQEIFKSSTGLKPFCNDQITSIHHSQQVIQRGGRVVKSEPRGFGKTSRSTNEFLMGVLEGAIPYALILGSTTEKVEEIITSITTELFENEELERLYPHVVACFKHVEKNPRKMDMQTYDGVFTHIYFNQGLIRFPILPGEPSSGAIINIRPKKNVRGIYFTDKSGPYAGQRRRPTHVLLDDIQTDEEAENPKTADRIVRMLKKSVFRSGSHKKRLNAVMTCTPIAPGDVSHHFLLKEPGWQQVIYQMLKTRAEREDLWLGEYATRRLNFDRKVPGSEEKAALDALQFFKDNYDEMLRGAEAAWEWCYEYDEDPQLEIHAVQHAYNIMILEGMEVFESECQCNVIATGTANDITFVPAEVITTKLHPRKRNEMSVNQSLIVTHIDPNQDYITYLTCASTAHNLNPEIIDYGVYPHMEGRFGKRKASRTLGHIYPHIPEVKDRVFKGVQDLLKILGDRVYRREDGITMGHNLILCDTGYQTQQIYKACRESVHANIIKGCQGESYKAKDKGIADKKYSDACTKYYHCVLVPNPDRTLMVLTVDNNFMKTQVHAAWAREPGTTGALSLFLPEYETQHALVGEHCNAELPMWDEDPRTLKKLIIWQQLSHQDNEYFDNLVGCFAGFSMLGCSFEVQATTQPTILDLAAEIEAQKRWQ